MPELVPMKHIKAKVAAGDWQEAIRAAGVPLAESGAIDPAYIDDMIGSVEEYGPYIVLTSGFALAHAAPSDLVKRDSVSLITLKAPVDFGSTKGPVNVVMCLACTDRAFHLGGLGRIASVLMKDNMIGKLSRAESRGELYQLING
ncbi:PTS sugar transporter subunit IIA [Coriobacteriales bacterium OH1046]|nr:PTS sugar transporter subunit IIA [Coriobacteriales bacterium OH1046]